MRRLRFGLALTLLAAASPSRATTVLAIRSDDRVILSADSRIQIVTGRKSLPRTGCKVHLAGGVAWTHAGYYANPETGFDLAALGNRAFSGAGTLDARLHRLARAVSEPLHRALLALRNADPKEYDEDIGSPLKIVAAGMEGSLPVVAVLQFERAPSGLLATRLYRCPGDCPGGTQYVSAGVHQQADRMVAADPASFFAPGWRDALRGLLDAEAAGHPDQVAAPYTIVEFNQSGMHWIDRGLCLDSPSR